MPSRSSRGRRRKHGAPTASLCLVLSFALGVALLSGCQVQRIGAGEAQLLPIVSAEPSPVSIPDMKVENRNGHVDPAFPSHPVVVGDTSGLETSRLLFRNSASLIIADPGIHSQLRAASLAVFAHAPMLVYTPERHAEIAAEITRLQAQRVLLIGDVAIAESKGVPTVFQDPGGVRALGEMTAHRFSRKFVSEDDDLIAEVIRLDGSEPVVLVPDWESGRFASADGVPSLPIQTRRDGLNAPVTVATEETPIVSVANARAYGAHVRYLDQPDPRESDTALAAMIGLADQPLLALGPQFGTAESLAEAIRAGERQADRAGVVSATPETMPE